MKTSYMRLQKLANVLCMDGELLQTYANLIVGKMYRDGEGVAINMKKAVHFLENYTKYDKNEGHWNLAHIYRSEEGYLNENRSFYHFRLAADLGNISAKEDVGEYFVSVSGPRKLCYTNEELQIFLRNIKS